MNIPPPMTKNNYETETNKIASFTKDVAEETMGDATLKYTTIHQVQITLPL